MNFGSYPRLSQFQPQLACRFDTSQITQVTLSGQATERSHELALGLEVAESTKARP